jgi:hypothetical protein
MHLEMKEESALCRVTLPIHFAKCHLDCPHCRYSDIKELMATIVYIQEGDIFGDERRKCCLSCDFTHSFRQMPLRLPALPLF